VIMHRLPIVILAMAVSAASVLAQEPPAATPAPAAPQRPAARQIVPLEIQVVVAKYQGEKRISSIPYVLALNAVAGGNLINVERAQLTIGSEVPVPSTSFAPAGDGKTAQQPLRSFSYRNVGTVVSAGAVPAADEGRFELDISIDESSVGTSVSNGQGQATTEMPVFKSFKTRNRILLRNGQTRQFTAATDRVSGETVRIEVTLTVVK
jgi:hypothetical protein